MKIEKKFNEDKRELCKMCFDHQDNYEIRTPPESLVIGRGGNEIELPDRVCCNCIVDNTVDKWKLWKRMTGSSGKTSTEKERIAIHKMVKAEGINAPRKKKKKKKNFWGA